MTTGGFRMSTRSETRSLGTLLNVLKTVNSHLCAKNNGQRTTGDCLFGSELPLHSPGRQVQRDFVLGNKPSRAKDRSTSRLPALESEPIVV